MPTTLDGLAKGYDVELHTTHSGESTAVYRGQHQVSGVLRDQAGQPVAGYGIEVLHRQLRSEPLVTSTQSGSDVSFRLSYAPEPLLGDDGRAERPKTIEVMTVADLGRVIGGLTTRPSPRKPITKLVQGLRHRIAGIDALADELVRRKDEVDEELAETVETMMEELRAVLEELEGAFGE